MSQLSIEEVVVKSLHEIIDTTNVNSKTNLLELGMDSMNFIRLVVQLEDEFDIEIPDEEIFLDNFSDIEKICQLVARFIR
jgi:acyl carrier protein